MGGHDEDLKSSSGEDSSCSSRSSGDSESYASVEESDSSSVSESEDSSCHEPQQELDSCYAAQVRIWTERVPIGLGFCPWAMKSKRQGRLHYETCLETTPLAVTARILARTQPLVAPGVPLWSTLLMVCPHVPEWKDDFSTFDEFVKCLVVPDVTLVSFHPQFLRWRGLPDGIAIGSAIQCHRGMGGFQKSSLPFPATVVETGNRVFGLRKIRVQFQDDSLQKQYVPMDWFSTEGDPLPDNAMHRAPHPTIHFIRNSDLVKICIRDVSRVKRKNAQRAMKLGWEGMQPNED